MDVKVWVLIVGVVTLGAAQADIYRKVENGQVIFSDHPFDGAEKIELSPLNTVPADSSEAQVMESAGKPGAASTYTVSISSPVDQQTYNYAQPIALAARVEPGLNAGERMVWTLDGQPLSPAEHSLGRLERGQHGVQVQVYDLHQKLLASASVTFFVRQTSALVHPH